LTSREQPDRIVVGRVLGAFGVRGEAKVAADAADLRAGLRVTVRDAGGAERELTIESIRPHQRHLVVKFAGFENPEAVGVLHGADLLAARDLLPALAPNVFRTEDLIGMRVTDVRLGDLGGVRDVVRYPQADMLVVGEKQLMIPMLAAYAVVVDVAQRSISCRLPDGFEDLYEGKRSLP